MGKVYDQAYKTEICKRVVKSGEAVSQEGLAEIESKIKTGLGKSDRPGLQGGSRKRD